MSYLNEEVNCTEPNYTENIICFFSVQATLMRRSTVLTLPFQLVFPAEAFLENHLIEKKLSDMCNKKMKSLRAAPRLLILQHFPQSPFLLILS